MKVGYPDTINNKAYKQVSPLKARYASSGEGEDLEAVELKSGSLAKKEDPPTNYNDTPINMITPIKAREMSAKRRARRGKRVEKIDAKANSIAEQKYLKGVAEEDLPTTAKKGKQKKYDRLTKKSDRISAKTTKILRDNNQVPSARKKKSPVKAVTPVKNKEKASSEAKASARKVAKGRKKYAKAHEASSQGFQETRKSKRLNKAGDRKTDKGREITNKLSPEQTEKAVEIFTKRVDKQDKKAERKKKSPAKFASSAQRKAVWASKNEKKKK